MPATVLTKAIRDRSLGTAVGSATMVVFLLFSMAVYRDIDLSLYTDLPESMRSLMNIGDDTDAGQLAYGAIYRMLGAFTISGLAISMGSSSVAGEERAGTIGLLLANPVSRQHVLVSKAAAMVTLIAAAVAVLWFGGLGVPALLDVDVSGLHTGALLVHLFVSSLFYGALALAIGASTGRGPVASGSAAALMVVSYLAVNLLPLVDGWENVARLFPWYYYDGSDPLANGIDWIHVVALLGVAAALVGVAVVAVERRDLRGRSSAVTLIDRMRSHPATRRLADRLAGSTRVSHIWTKAASEHQGVLVVTVIAMVCMGVLMGPMYALMDDDLKSLSDQLGETMTALIGGVDMGTPEGFIQAETFAITAPIAFITLATIMGTRSIAGEEADGTMGLLLANPVTRRTIVVAKACAMTVAVGVLGGATFAATWIGVALGGLEIAAVNQLATSVNAALLGLVFGSLALAIGAATGRSAPATYGTVGAALTSHLAFSFLPLSDSLAGWERLSPFFYYLGGDPLVNGFRWSHVGVLAALTALLVASAAFAFERRDLR